MLRGRSLGQAIGVVALVCATFGVSTASAQVDYEIMASLQFNFSNPGARSLAMAGALTGAGDDATGAWTNPGGLTNITRPEVGVEFRGFNFETPFVVRRPLQRQRRRNIGHRHTSGLTYGNSNDSTHSLSFVSAVVPKSRFAFAFYRTEVANFETNIQTSGPVLRRSDRSACARPPRPDLLRPRPARQRQPRPPDLELRRLGRRPAHRPGVGRRRRVVLRLQARLDEPALRHLGRRPQTDAGRASSVSRRSRFPATSTRPSSSTARTPRRRQRRRVDQPERQVPHRRQLSPGAEVRHRLPARGRRRLP